MTMDKRPRVWNRRRPINYPKQIEMTGGIAAPLLVGFSLTTVAQLVIGRDHPWLSEWAIAAFAVAAALLVYALQFSAAALAYAATPSDRLDLNPETAFDTEILRIIRKRQWEEMELRATYTKRVKYCYNLGLLAFLSGLGLILVPHQSWPWPLGRAAGIIAITASLIVEAMWILSDGKWPAWLLPTSRSVTPDYFPDEGARYLFGGDGNDEIVSSLRQCVALLEQLVTQTPQRAPRRAASATRNAPEPDDSRLST